MLASITGDLESARRGVASGDPAMIAASGPDPDNPGPRTLHRALCSSCQGARSSVDVKLLELVPRKNEQPKMKTLAHTSWPGESLAALESACRPAPAHAVAVSPT